MSLIDSYNVGAEVIGVQGTSSLSIAQTSASAATTQDGLTIDRTGLPRRFYSAKAVAAFGYLAASTQTVATLSLNFQHSSDGSSWDNYSTATVPTAATFGTSAAGGGTTYYGVVSQSVNLNGARRYVRVQVPAPTYANCSSGQGVFSGGVTVIFGGPDTYPASTS